MASASGVLVFIALIQPDFLGYLFWHKSLSSNAHQVTRLGTVRSWESDVCDLLLSMDDRLMAGRPRIYGP
jgi:hypothetical protein